MAKFSMTARRRRLLYGAAITAALVLVGCGAVEVQNRQAAQELARLANPPGSVYTGWRVFLPAWQGEPRVNAHIVDLYAYLSARAQGTQGPDRPARL